MTDKEVKNSPEEINQLIVAYLLDFITGEQMARLQQWREKSSANDNFFKHICDSKDFQENYIKYKEIDYKKAMKQFVVSTNTRPTFIMSVKPYLKYAAIFLLLLSIGVGTFYFNKQINNQLAVNQIEPGSSKAILILEDGSKVMLHPDSVQQIQSGKTMVATNTSAGIAYDDNGNRSGTVRQNTLMVPRGGEYRITLADGTKVHLNSASELSYPVSFDPDKPREVTLKGEGYFEVAKRTSQSFIVHVGDLNVKQYGTAFNINSYTPQRIKIVLVHGSIGVKQSDQSKEQMLKPSQLADYNADSKSLSVTNVDVESYVAWNSGMFNFENENLENIMQILSLWYDIDVQFDKGDLKDLRFTGNINRSVPIDGILDAIKSTTDVQIALKGRKVMIYK